MQSRTQGGISDLLVLFQGGISLLQENTAWEEVWPRAGIGQVLPSFAGLLASIHWDLQPSSSSSSCCLCLDQQGSTNSFPR